MNLVLEIKALQTKRTEHVIAIREIDEQLAEIRTALGVTEPVRTVETFVRRQRQLQTNPPGGTQTRIIEALKVRQPQTITMLKGLITDVTTVQQHVLAMHLAHRLVRRAFPPEDAGGRRWPYWYALTEAALDAYDATLRECGGPLDPSSPVTALAGAGTTSETATNGTEPNISDVANRFDTLNAGNGQP